MDLCEQLDDQNQNQDQDQDQNHTTQNHQVFLEELSLQREVVEPPPLPTPYIVNGLFLMAVPMATA